jgi:hypothetical protein
MACGVVEESLPIMGIRRGTDLFTFEQDTMRRAPAAGSEMAVAFDTARRGPRA